MNNSLIKVGTQVQITRGVWSGQYAEVTAVKLGRNSRGQRVIVCALAVRLTHGRASASQYAHTLIVIPGDPR